MSLSQLTEKQKKANKIEMFENKIKSLAEKIKSARENSNNILENILLTEYKNCNNYLTELKK